MKKILSLLALIALVATGCSNSDDAEPTGVMAPVKVHVTGFSVEQSEIPATKATQAIADYAGIKAMTLAFYDASGALKYSSTQLRADATTYTTFGDFSLNLAFGSYKMVVMAYGSEVPVVLNSMTDVSFGEDKSRETFTYTQDVTINDATPVNLTAVLNRIVARLTIMSLDARPESATNIRVTFAKGGKSFNPITGFATTDTGFINLIVPNTAVGETTGSLTNFFLASDEETMDVTIETLDASSNVLFTTTVPDVPFKRNRATILTGYIYSAASTASFTVETSYEPALHINF